MWRWDQSAHELSRNGTVRDRSGYCGHGRGKNNPAMQAAKGTGPIPAGKWRMTSIGTSPNTGPSTIVLQPEPGTQTFGRGDFRIHGDSIRDPGNASHGCIILPKATRLAIWSSGDRELEVIA